MHKAISMIRNLALGVALWATAGTALAITLSAFPTNFNAPVGIDFYEPLSKLILSVNYPSGSPNNLDLVDLGTGNHVNYSTLVGLTNEVKVATVRSGSCQGGFNVGDAFTGNGTAGEIVYVPFGSPGVAGPVTNPWVQLNIPAGTEPALIRGSLFQDRFCAAGGDLIVVSGNEQLAGNPGGINSIGNVWRVTSGKVATKVATIGTHLEGVTTVPNDPTLYGPLAGRILAGMEEFDNTFGPPTYAAGGGRIVAVNPNAVDDFFTIGGPGTTGIGAHTHYLTLNSFHPEDLDIIRGNADFFGVDYSNFPNGIILTAAGGDFNGLCGRVLITQEFPNNSSSGPASSPSGLTTLRWNGTSFVTEPLASNLDGQIPQWEHTTFTSGQDCFGLKVVKTPDKGDAGSIFTQGSQVQFQIVVTNTGAAPDDITLTDALPGNGGLLWASATPALCSISGAQGSQVLTCNLGIVAAGASVTITVTSTATTPVAACQDQPNDGTLGLTNFAIATDTHGNKAQDGGFLTCTPQAPPQLKVVKSPKAGTFAEGGQTSYSIVVSNPAAAGSGSATNVTLTDQLPGNGGLVWSSVSTSQGSCTIVANLLSCNLGTIPPQGSVTVTVTSAANTPVAACQDQPNNGTLGATNLAKATADGGLTAQDIGDLTCTPNLVTVTQGGWHATPHGNNPGTVLNAYFAAHPGYAPKIGDITNACGGKVLTFTSANAIRAFLPATSTPGVLTASATNPTTPPGTAAGVFAGQVLALTLNTQVLSSGGSLLNFVITSGPATGKTVGQVLADANKALGGCGLPSYVTSISQLNDVVTAINEKFDTL